MTELAYNFQCLRRPDDPGNITLREGTLVGFSAACS